MSNIIPNTQKVYLYPNPKLIKEKFSFMGRLYILLNDYALISEPNSMVPAEGRGFFNKLPKKDFKDMKKKYEENRTKWLIKVGYLKEGGVQNSFSF